MKLLIINGNLVAHGLAKRSLEGFKINEPITIFIKHILHQGRNVLFRGVDLVLRQVILKVFIRDKTVLIVINLLEHLVHAESALEGLVLDLAKEISEPPCFTVIGFVVGKDSRLRVSEPFIGPDWRWVGSETIVEPRGQLGGIFLKNNWGY